MFPKISVYKASRRFKYFHLSESLISCRFLDFLKISTFLTKCWPIVDPKYTLQEAQIFTGTTILLFTDGLTEAMNGENEEFQMDRINDVASRALAAQQQEPHQLIALMTDAVHKFVGDAEQSDDLTMMGIQYIKTIEQRE